MWSKVKNSVDCGGGINSAAKRGVTIPEKAVTESIPFDKGLK